MQHHLIAIFSMLLTVSAMLVAAPASNAASTNTVDFEHESAQWVEDFETIERVTFDGNGAWERLDVPATDLFDGLSGAVIADTSFAATPIRMRFDRPYGEVALAFGFGQQPTSAAVTVLAFAGDSLVFADEITATANAAGYLEGRVLVDVPADTLMVQAHDAHTMLVIDNIVHSEDRLTPAAPRFAPLHVASDTLAACALLTGPSTATVKAGGPHLTAIQHLLSACA